MGYDHGPETPWMFREPETDSFQVSAPHSSRRYWAPGAEVVVQRPKTTYNYDNQSTQWTPLDETRNTVRQQFGEGAGGQGALFGVQHRRPYVGMMATHPDYRAHIPTLLALADMHTRARYKEPLQSDSSLSESSSKIVHRLAEAGAVQLPDQEIRNHIDVMQDFRQHEVATRGELGDQAQEFDPATIHMGRQFVRQALARQKQKIPRNKVVRGIKGKQEKLFE